MGLDGANKKYYTGHKVILSRSSDFFKKACNKEWKEGQSKIIRLPEVEPEAFDIYLQYLYTGEVVATDDELPEHRDGSREAQAQVVRLHWILIETYLLADMLLDTKSKNAIMDAFIEILKDTKRLPDLDTITDVFRKTTDTSPMRRLLVDFVAFRVDLDTFKGIGARHSPEFLVEVSLRLMRYKDDVNRRTDPIDTPSCRYHEHDEAHLSCK